MAQNNVEFVLTSDGTYKAANGDDFIVVPFPDKSAHEIYKELATNINSHYKKPTEIMTGVEDSFIKIRDVAEEIISLRLLGVEFPYSGYYQLEFRIKDGRVRVSAPIIEPQVWSESDKEPSSFEFAAIVKKHFNKDGSLKNGKHASDYANSVANMNKIINNILNPSNSKSQNDDW